MFVQFLHVKYQLEIEFCAMPGKARKPKKKVNVSRKKAIDNAVASITEEFQSRMAKLDERKTELLSALSHEIELMIMSIPPDDRDKTFEQLALEEEAKEQKAAAAGGKSSGVVDHSRSRKRSLSCIIEDEGYRSTSDSAIGHVNGRRLSRSLTRSRNDDTSPDNTNPTGSSNSTRQSRGIFKTPTTGSQTRTFRPQVDPNTAIMMFRRPKPGEVAVSLFGSPLQMSTMSSNTANVNIPFNNGTTMSVLPTRMRPFESQRCPPINPELRQQIKGLMENLDRIMKN